MLSKTKGKLVTVPPVQSALVESMRNIGYTLDTALADIFDNSITAGAKEISVNFLWEGGTPWIAITDDGCGMSADELKNSMRFGSLSPLDERDKNDLGRFGLGMKTASISQCRWLTVISKRGNEISACEWNLDAIEANQSNEWLLFQLNESDLRSDGFLGKIISEKLEKCSSGTVVLWRTLDRGLVGAKEKLDEKRFSEQLDNARSHLETVFHRFLSPDPGYTSVKMNFNGSALVEFNPFGPSIPSRQELPTEEIVLKLGKIQVQPFVLPHHSKVTPAEYQKYAGEAGYFQNQGFYIYRNRRLIVKATWFRLIRKEELNKLIRVRIDIPNTLDHLWSINVNKSQVRPPEEVRRQLKNIIQQISGAGKLVYKRRATSLQKRNLTSVWSREVSDGSIQYCINRKHPLVRHLLENTPKDFSQQLSSCLEILVESFPYDALYADVASDTSKLATTQFDRAQTLLACTNVMEALKACGYESEQIRSQMLKTEIPGATSELINEILTNFENNGKHH